MAAGLFGRYEHHRGQCMFSQSKSMKKVQKVKGFATNGAPCDFPTETVPEYDVWCTRQVQSKSHSHGTSSRGQSETATLSDDSCSLKRKSISVNAENGKHAFMKTHQTFYYARLTSTEKKMLRRRLKSDLGKLQSLYLKLEARESELRGLSQFSQRSQSHSHGTAGASIQEQVKNCLAAPMKSNLNPNAGSKRNFEDGKLDTEEQKRQKLEFVNSKKISEMMRQCNTVLRKLMLHRHGWVFNSPVDVVKLGLHDYFKIIKKPMDLGTISSKLENNQYSSPLEFAEDVRLTFSNAMIYNPEGDEVHNMAAMLKRIFEERWKQLDEKIKDMQLSKESDQEFKLSQRQKPLFTRNVNSSSLLNSQVLTTRKDSNAAVSAKSLKHPTIKDRQFRPPMTFEQKCQLSRSLKRLPFKKLVEIVEIIKRKNPNLAQEEDEIEVEFEDFDTETLWEIHEVVMSHGNDSSSGRNRGLKLLNSFEISNQMSLCKGADSRVGNIDAGKDVESTNCPPSVIDNAGEELIKYNKSRSLRDDSGCSSAESDSVIEGSDSGNSVCDSDTCFRKVSPEKLQGPAGSGAITDHSYDCTCEINVTNGSMLDAEVASLKTTTIEAISQQGGENTVSERQVSPEKLLRAALLKNRFADTILRAQEKTLPFNKDVMSDPDKLRKEREHLERRQREEKTRLQAEARAAESARKKAEAEAAAEARRKREVEREAARLALQRMEKTVEIDENVEILKDLEMLQAASEHLPSSGDETSPACSPNDVSVFALQGRNTLEQLGLYMKDDEDEEEEHERVPSQEQHSNPIGSCDEEGEIEG